MGRPKNTEEIDNKFKLAALLLAIAIFLIGILSTVGYHAAITHIEKNGVKKYQQSCEKLGKNNTQWLECDI